MNSFYTFPLNETGQRLRENLVASLTRFHIPFREFQEEIAGFTCLRLEITGKRPGEGKIAADMKARKHVS